MEFSIKINDLAYVEESGGMEINGPAKSGGLEGVYINPPIPPIAPLPPVEKEERRAESKPKKKGAAAPHSCQRSLIGCAGVEIF